ncbi:UNVERIFIED_CONTAM: hypothetical protein GTU68_048169 [Idotea baltica]|nr:hypothetical protein [Idotea baltica]
MEINAGKLLLAQPFMLDPNFKRSVVLVCEHDTNKGSLGFIMNKPLHMKIQELISDFPEIESAVYFGGPVATDTIHYIHDKGDLLEDSVEVYKGLFWGGDFERLKFLIETKLIKESNIQFFVGYSGWSEEQLLDELNTGSWITADMDPNYLFHKDENILWKKVMENKGNSYGVIGQIPESHRLN